MSYPQHPYGQQPQGGQPPYGAQQPYGVQPQYAQAPYGAQPPMGGAPTPPPMTSPPPSMVRAKWAMWTGAFLTMLYTPAGAVDMRLLGTGEWEDLATEFSDSTAEGIFLLAMGIGVLFSILFAALWVLIAHFSVKGQEWARITGSILFALWVVLFLCGLLGATLGLTLLVNTLLVLAGLAATVFLWLPDSCAWFRQHKAPRYPY